MNPRERNRACRVLETFTFVRTLRGERGPCTYNSGRFAAATSQRDRVEGRIPFVVRDDHDDLDNPGVARYEAQ